MEESEVLLKQAKVFEKWSFVRDFISRFRYFEASPHRLLFREFKKTGLKRKKEIVLDFGFGNAKVLFWFTPPTGLYGIELSDLAIKRAVKKAIRKGYAIYEFIKPPVINSNRIPFSDELFSVVIACHSLEHVYDDEELLKELYRTCKVGGKCFLIVPIDIYSENVVLEKEKRINPDFGARSFHVFLYNLQTLETLVIRSGFKIIRSYSADSVMDFQTKHNTAGKPLGCFLSLLPFSIWNLIDKHLKRKGFKCKQGIIVASK